MQRRAVAWRMSAAALLVVVLAGCSARNIGRHGAPEPTSTPTPPSVTVTEGVPATVAPPPADLGTVEVRAFQGKRLDAIADQPENSIKGPQHIDARSYRLDVSGMVRKPVRLTYAQITRLPAYRKVTTLHCVDGWEVTYLWQGVLLSDLLDRVGADPAATIVIFRCADGYTESLPVDYIRKRHILLAYGMNGTVLPAERGFPFQVVAEDKYGYKWAKWITGIELSADERFRGYWEQRGADNTATLPPRTK
jgi:DMSO/TMAO reductase YedYZ molybdopterin-dependent catalytic subunit